MKEAMLVFQAIVITMLVGIVGVVILAMFNLAWFYLLFKVLVAAL